MGFLAIVSSGILVHSLWLRIIAYITIKIYFRWRICFQHIHFINQAIHFLIKSFLCTSFCWKSRRSALLDRIILNKCKGENKIIEIYPRHFVGYSYLQQTTIASWLVKSTQQRLNSFLKHHRNHQRRKSVLQTYKKKRVKTNNLYRMVTIICLYKKKVSTFFCCNMMSICQKTEFKQTFFEKFQSILLLKELFLLKE